MKPTLLALSFLGVMIMSGCVWPVPHRSERSPEVRGRVVDALTREPIRGATIALHEHPSTAARSDSAGIYRLGETHNLHLITFMGICSSDFPQGKYYGDELDVSRPGYQTSQIRAREYRASQATNEGPMMLRDIALNPLK